ncbi:hypothetical protein QNI19_11365 [Cytophagaceae bacterium DM2B3-1]|uniref:Lipoprotein n=1 Tax=Xanthocytophaga flava TaxID=3048013 RepID=A0ABT7CII1_9BACT|nr:hypothetical protein [Xanthocytophaga flavus]MDJ1469588.1 hypothetical protein [Xanthocytophaga flavus]MDJ1493533.1 hypothetical protein [Xanthocytophaga flavus]
MRKFYPYLFLFFIVCASYAQCGFGSPALMKKLAQRELIVIMEQPSQKVIELMKKKKKHDQVVAYEEGVEAYNAALKHAVQKYWKWDSSANYMTMNDADRLRKTQVKNYAVIYCTTIDNFTIKGDEGGRNHQRLLFPENYKQLNALREHWRNYSVMEIKLLEDLPKSQPLFRQNLPNITPEKADLVFGVQAVEHYLIDSTLQARATPYEWEEVLPRAEADMHAKTLLLRKDWLAQGLTYEDIKEVYPYPFVIVDAKRFNESAVKGNPNLALLQIVPEILSKRQKIVTNYLHAVIDSMTGLPLGFVRLKAEDGKDKYISEESMKELAQYLKKRTMTVVGNK